MQTETVRLHGRPPVRHRTRAGHPCHGHQDLPFNVDRITETEYMIEENPIPLPVYKPQPMSRWNQTVKTRNSRL